MLSVPNFPGGNAALSSSHSLVPPRPDFSYHLVLKKATAISRCPCNCSLGLQDPLEESREIFRLETQNDGNDLVPSDLEGDEEQEEEKGISKIQVSREKYIPVSKTELLDAVLLNLFDSQNDDNDEANQFLLLSSCLDSILHAEHKSILEEMRADYSLTQSIDDERISNGRSGSSDERDAAHGKISDSVSNNINGNGSVNKFEEETEVDRTLRFDYGVELRNFLSSSVRNDKRSSNGESRLAVATRFQRSFMQLLTNAQFEELSARDLMLTSALNSDYLLTLPIYVDWKKASESNAIIFRRGYETERQKGLLIVEKLDYIQSRLLQGIFFLISKPVGKVGTWIKEAFRNASESHEVQDGVKKMTPWLEQLSLFQQSYFSNEQAADNPLVSDQLSDSELPIWLAAQRAVSRYEGFLSPVGPRGRLFRKLLTWTGFVPPLPEKPFEPDSYSNPSQPHLRPIFLSRISISDIWRPATKKHLRDNIWKKLKTSFSILLSQSVLQEPAFQELILLYTTETSDSDAKNKAEVPALQLKIYERIPIPDLPREHFSPFVDSVEIAAEKMEQKGHQVNCRQSVGDECERFLYDVFKVKVEMPVEEAMNTLVRLGLVTETPIDGRRTRLQVVPCEKVHESLGQALYEQRHDKGQFALTNLPLKFASEIGT
ncbi:unnamed protein product [Dovyalis caffra]|uniref:Uncharacterized protein n=1 Tax=Dovyalis caffra TaxID=77055 RepID=A0AAV1SC65_9ROSI|nr:unnamed protein product [Dovyalis caffra]